MIVAEPIRPGEHCLLAGNEYLNLVFVDLEGFLVKWKSPPPNGWTYELLGDAEFQLHVVIDGVKCFLGHDAYLEQIWIGSSEC